MNLEVKLAEFAVIETKRLILRPFRWEDAEAMFEFSGVPENMTFVFGVHLSVEEARRMMVHDFMSAPLGKWAIELKKNKKMIGLIHFVKISEKTGQAELGYVLNRDYWRQGLLTEALSVLSEFSFEVFGLKRLILMIDEENLASQRLAEKTGYRLKKTIRAANPYTGIIRHFRKYEWSKREFYQSLSS